jgi:hypothetical protein
MMTNPTDIYCSRSVPAGGRSVGFRPCANRATAADDDGNPVCGVHRRSDQQRAARRAEYARDWKARETATAAAAARADAVAAAAPDLDPQPHYVPSRGTGMGRYDPSRIVVDADALARLLGIDPLASDAP